MTRQTAIRLSEETHERLRALAAMGDPRSIGEALKGSPRWANSGYRVGAYRLICRIEDARLVVLVVAVGHRQEVYH